jgi:hypothetical protein
MCIGFVIFGNITLGHGYLLMEFVINPLTPELDPSEQRCLPEFFYWGF